LESPLAQHPQSTPSWKNIFLDTFLFEISTPLRTRVLLTLGIFISVFLLVFKPFYLDNIPFAELLQTAIGSGVSFFFVGAILNSLRGNGYWVLKNQPLLAELLYLVLLIILVGLMVYLLRLRTDVVELSWRSALQFQYFALIMALIPLSMSRLIISLIKLQRDVRTRNELLQPADSPIEEPPIKLIVSDNEEEFSFPFDKWIAGKAAGNYVELFFSTDNPKPTVLLRTTLKILTEAMEHKPNFFHCHRSFVVNLDYVTEVTGSPQSYKMELRGLENTIPVSRNTEKQLLQKLNR